MTTDLQAGSGQIALVPSDLLCLLLAHHESEKTAGGVFFSWTLS